jgi:hypothetical protein
MAYFNLTSVGFYNDRFNEMRTGSNNKKPKLEVRTHAVSEALSKLIGMPPMSEAEVKISLKKLYRAR